MSVVGASVVALSILMVACRPAPADDTSANTALIERFMAGLDAHDFAVIEEVMCPDVVLQLAGETMSRDEFIPFAQGAYQTFPDFQHGIEDLFAVGDKVVLRANDRATHAESGIEIAVGQISIYQIRDGCVSHMWEEYDRHGLLQQLTPPDGEGAP